MPEFSFETGVKISLAVSLGKAARPEEKLDAVGTSLAFNQMS